MEALTVLRVPGSSISLCKSAASGVAKFPNRKASPLAVVAQTFHGAVSSTAASGQSRQGRTNGEVVAKSNRVVVASVSESLTSAQDARKESLKKEKDSQIFTLEDVEVVTPQDWNPAIVAEVKDVADGVRCVTVVAECSREFVKLEKAYRKPGQLVQVKVNGRKAVVPASSAPVSDVINSQVLYKIRGDIPAGTTKLPAFSISAKAPVDLHVTKADSPALFNVEKGSEIELGPFGTTGLDLRPILFLSRFPSILLFVQGKGIAVGRAILETKDADAGTLNLGFREDVRLYYSASQPSSLAYKDLFSKWEERRPVKVRTTVDRVGGEDWDGAVGSFTDLWDEDDIEYDPLTTGVIVAVEKVKRKELKDLLAEAGIPEAQIVFWEV